MSTSALLREKIYHSIRFSSIYVNKKKHVLELDIDPTNFHSCLIYGESSYDPLLLSAAAVVAAVVEAAATAADTSRKRNADVLSKFFNYQSFQSPVNLICNKV